MDTREEKKGNLERGCKSRKKNDAWYTLIKLDKEYPDNKLKSKVAKKVSELNCAISSEWRFYKTLSINI